MVCLPFMGGSMAKMADVRNDHGKPCSLAAVTRVLIADAAAGLDDGRHARLAASSTVSRNGKNPSRPGPTGAAFAPGPAPKFHVRDLQRVDAGHLPGADARG